MAGYKGVMILGEVSNGALSTMTTEILGAAHGLADALNEEVICVLVGNKLEDTPQSAIAYGADKVYTVVDPLLEEYQAELYLNVMQTLVEEVSPRILLMGHTSIGRDLAPRLAFRLGVSLSMDCLELHITPDSKLLEQTRLVYGGNACAIFTSEVYPQMATIRRKTVSALERDELRKGEIVPYKVAIDSSQIKAKVINTVKEEVEGVKLEDAEVIIAGGRGIGGEEGFKQLEALAKILKGAVGASRPPCDQGWMNSTLQIGLTGKIVTPQLYIAVGISGAQQHLMGCSGSKYLVAINKDPEADIFNNAHIGVIGDWKHVIPAFTEKVKELLSSSR